MPGFVVRAGVQNEEKRAITMFGIIHFFPHWRVGTARARTIAQVVYWAWFAMLHACAS